MNKKILIGLLAVVVLLTVGVYYFLIQKEEQKVYRIGILAGVQELTPLADNFRAKMAQLGYIEGENIVYDLQVTNVEPEREKEIINKFIKDKVDLIFTFPTEVSMFAKELTKESKIPVVFSFANVEGTDLIDSIANPGGNVTGARFPGPDLAVKRFEVMMELAPEIKTILVPFQKDYPIVQSQLDVLRPAAQEAGVALVEFPAKDAAELKVELDRISELDDIGIDAILSIAEPLSIIPDSFAAMVGFADDNNIPFGGNYMSIQGQESLFGIIINLMTTGEQAASLANKILSGSDPGTIPVVSSESYFQLSYKKAEELGIVIPAGLLGQADEIIQ
jgi:putative ABC transport system substrate-binding protein